MKIDIYDSYARGESDQLIHFDVIVEAGTSKEAAFEFGRSWLKEIGENPDRLDQSRCTYCHSEIASQLVRETIEKSGFYILQMEGCPDPI